MNFQEIEKLDAYFKRLFGSRVRVILPPKVEEPAEVFVGQEFVGILFVDEEEDERSYNFQMSIMERDLE